MPAPVLEVNPRAPEASLIARAVTVLRGGGLVAFPTETFYGLGAAALNAAATRRLLQAKGRPEGKPILVLVDGVAMVERITVTISAEARRLMARHWPGALTLVLKAATGLPDEITAGTGTIGVRLSPHPVALALVRELGEPVTAPSANRSGAPPPTTAAAVLAGIGDGLDLVLDGGATSGGEPSTVLDVTTDPPRVLRAGAVHLD
ncbi:MAG: L-threonylcarbamoyladenylate synthase [Candidatus Rokuibacteriota bacterium]